MFGHSLKPGLMVLSLILLTNTASSAEKTYLGISLAAKIPPSVAAHLEIDGGAMIIAVFDGSPAAKAGLKEHDIIIKAAGMAVKSPGDLRKALDSRKPSESEEALALVVRRGTKTLDFTVKPTDAPAKRSPPKGVRKKTGVQANAKAYLGVGLDAIPASLAKHDIVLTVAGKAVTSNGRRTGSRSIILPDEFKDLQLGGSRGGITGELRIESLRSLLGQDRNRVSSNLNQLIASHRPGEEIELEIIQQGERKKIRVELAAAPVKSRSIFSPGTPGGLSSSSSSVSSVTINDGDLSITVRNSNGKKTFSVRRGKEIIARDEPWEALDKLPEEIQEMVRQLNPGPAGKPERGKKTSPPSPGEKKLPPGKQNKKPI